MKEINVSWRQNPFLDVHDNTRIALGFSFSFVSLLSFVTPPSSNSYIIVTNYLGAILFYLIYRYNFFLLSFELESISCCFNFREGYWRRLLILVNPLSRETIYFMIQQIMKIFNLRKYAHNFFSLTFRSLYISIFIFHVLFYSSLIFALKERKLEIYFFLIYKSILVWN